MRHYFGQALSDNAKPGAGATINVNLAGSSTKATLYSDDGFTVKPNPFTADNFGHFDFYAASGKYDISITGTGVTPYTFTAEVVFDPFGTSSGDTAQSLRGTFISGSANPASTGIVRLASADAVNFRNNANSADITALSKNAGDVVLLGGPTGAQTNGPLSVPTGNVLSADQVVPLNSLGQCGFWAVSVYVPQSSVGSAFCLNANEVRAYQFVLPFRVQIGKVSFQLTNTQTGSTGDFGIYDMNGNRLAYTGGFSTAFGGPSNVPLASVVTLNAGYYYFAQTNSSTTPAPVCFAGGNGLAATSGSKSVGIAANAANNGVLPATLGSITVDQMISPAICYFER